jgi:tetratricopeptide (TPR) repeat protein
MKKTNAFILIVFLSAVGACYNSGSSNTTKPPQTTATASPVAGKSVEPANQTSPKTSNSGDLPPNDKAVAELEETVKKDPKNQQAYFQLGKGYQALKNEEKAVGAYKKAIEIKPDFAEANYALGRVYFDKKDYETSLPYLQKAAKVKYTSAEYLVAVGDNYRFLNRCNYAMPPYGNSLGFDDKNPAAYYGMGLCYIELKNKLAAASQLRPLEKLDKNLAKDLEERIAQK